jgi:hypothetical protein
MSRDLCCGNQGAVAFLSGEGGTVVRVSVKGVTRTGVERGGRRALGESAYSTGFFCSNERRRRGSQRGRQGLRWSPERMVNGEFGDRNGGRSQLMGTRIDTILGWRAQARAREGQERKLSLQAASRGARK